KWVCWIASGVCLLGVLLLGFATGKRGSDVRYLLLALGLLGTATGFAWLGVRPLPGPGLRQVCFVLAMVPLLGLFVAAIRTHHVVLRQAVTLSSLVLLGLWAS